MTSLVPNRGPLTVVKKIVILMIATFANLLVTLLAVESSAQAPQNKLTQRLQNPQSDFGLLGALVQSKPQREEIPQMTLANLTARYRLENSPNQVSFLGLSLDYSYTWAQYKDETHSQFDGVTASLARSFKMNPSSYFNYGVEVELPANQADSDAGFAGSLSVPLEIALRFSRQTISFALQPSFYNYKFKTSTEDGVEYNKKIAGLATVALNSRFTKRFAWRNSVSLFEYQNMIGNTYQVYSMSSFLRYQILASITLLGGIVSHDRVITTNSVLADDITSTRVGTEWSY